MDGCLETLIDTVSAKNAAKVIVLHYTVKCRFASVAIALMHLNTSFFFCLIYFYALLIQPFSSAYPVHDSGCVRAYLSVHKQVTKLT